MSDSSLKGRVAAVTGSSSGIGKAIAIELASCGADIGISYHSNPDSGNEVATTIQAMGRKACAAQLNVGEEPSVREFFQSVESNLGPVDILVNCAGIDGKTGKVWEISPEDWDQVIQVNLRGPYLCIHQVVEGMMKRGRGAILNITSVHEQIPWSGHTAYCATKSAMAMMTRSLALELQDSGVRVLSLAPGAIRTPINRDVWEDPDKMKDLKTKIPLGRIGEVEEIARVARMLVSDEASYMTGVTVTVDGAMTTYPSFAHGG
ncbi:glucose 1-dehydrogenase [Luteolibacter pohnpeiensis]|uniref:Glucose 1-dehydrogenase n=1 Tax=Luteolibacter pohnpeiensis TaxID=454153 RepID=A0A934S714_9BACT|nr:glucose 1-dehydrogenase [Luteolibacter pohnpeiensis]MBK1882450.1 glucose 1-dehydrogenase [Luteolibacter pohnpeiensis]